jgi:hypothetical protein
MSNELLFMKLKLRYELLQISNNIFKYYVSALISK